MPLAILAMEGNAGLGVDSISGVVTAVTGAISSVAGVVAANPIMLIGIAAGLVALGIKLFKRLTRTGG